MKEDHFIHKWKSKNTCFQQGSQQKHHTSTHEYFQQPKVHREKQTKQNGDKTMICTCGLGLGKKCSEAAQSKS